MKKKNDIKDQAVAAIGSIAGGGLGLLAGPVESLILGGVGSIGALVVYKYAPEFFENSLTHKILNNSKVATVLREKILSDLKNSFISSQGDFDCAMRRIHSLMEEANNYDSSIGSIDSWLQRNFYWALVKGEISDEEFQSHLLKLSEYCEKNGEINTTSKLVV